MNFKAYPEEWARHAALRAAARRWQRRGQLPPAQAAAIEAAYPVAYVQPSWWLRIGLAVVTALGVLTSIGFIGLITNFKLEAGVWASLVLLSTWTSLELAIHGTRHYYSGLDNVLLYSALLSAAVLLAQLVGESAVDFPAGPDLWRWLLPMLAVLLLALWRYADPVVAAAALAAALALLANRLLQVGAGRWLLPFAVMLAAGMLLRVLRGVPQRADYWYYRPAYLTLRTLGLAVLYLAGNYLVVREGNAALLPGYRHGPSLEIPLAPLFWVLTGLVPLLYLGLALRRHDRLLLWLGMLAIAFSVYTVRTYHSVLPPAVAATLAGALLTGLALWALRYLRQPRHGLTAEADGDRHLPVNLESFITTETAHVPAAPMPGFEFGGGSSGGGGAEAQW